MSGRHMTAPTPKLESGDKRRSRNAHAADIPASAKEAERAPDAVGRLLRIGEVMCEVALSRAQIYRLIKDPDKPFPEPIKIGCASRWSSSEIAAWKQSLLASRGKGR